MEHDLQILNGEMPCGYIRVFVSCSLHQHIGNIVRSLKERAYEGVSTGIPFLRRSYGVATFGPAGT
jgi:hypothetical protein